MLRKKYHGLDEGSVVFHLPEKPHEETKLRAEGRVFTFTCATVLVPTANHATPDSPGDREQTGNASPAIIRTMMVWSQIHVGGIDFFPYLVLTHWLTMLKK